MENQTESKLTMVERRIVQRLLKSRSAEDIAGMLEKPLEQVAQVIEEFTNHEPGRTSFDQMKQEKRARKKRKKKIVEKERVKDKSAEPLPMVNKDMEKNKRGPGRPAPQPYLGKHPKRKYADRKQDYSQQIPVKIDNRTTIYVDAGTDIELAKQKFLASKPNHLKPFKKRS